MLKKIMAFIRYYTTKDEVHYTSKDEFFQAVTNQNLLIIQKYLREYRNSDAHINAIDDHGRTALMLAVEQGNLPIVEALLAAPRTSCREFDRNGNTALINAVVANKLSIVQAIIAAPKSNHRRLEYLINECNRLSETPLMVAAFHGHVSIVKALISVHSCDLDFQYNKLGETALMMAIRQGHLSIVETLLAQRNCNLNHTNQLGQTALLIAVREGHLSIVKALLANFRPTPDIYKTAFLWAVYYGHLPIVRAFLATPSIDLNKTEQNGYNALIYAAMQGHSSIVQILIDTQRVNLNTATQEGNTALIWAASLGHLSTVQTLIKCGVNIAIKNQLNFTAAQAAKHYGHHDIASLLVDKAQQCSSRPSFQERLDNIGYNGDTVDYNDPILHHVMSDPITVSTGFSYDRESIKTYFDTTGAKTIPCPMSRGTIRRKELTTPTNISLKQLIEKFVTEQEKNYADNLRAQADAQADRLKMFGKDQNDFKRTREIDLNSGTNSYSSAEKRSRH